MAKLKPFNLFVYGTLMNPQVFRAVLGRSLVTDPKYADGQSTFYPRPAVLHGYRKVSPDRAYLYAVPDPQGRIRGYVIGPLPGECMGQLRKYEGKNYHRRRLKVVTSEGTQRAVVFVGNVNELRHHFGYAFNDRLKQEFLLGDKIEAALVETEWEQLHTDERLGRRAVGELHGDTIRDLKRRHFDAQGISDYAIRRSLRDVPLRDYSAVVSDPEAVALAPNYLELVIRQVLFNQVEDRIRERFRYELDQMNQGSEYYEHTISSVAALQLINTSAELLDILVGDCLTDLSFSKDRLVDFVQWAIEAADSIYDDEQARQQVQYIGNHIGAGYIPLGTELEFSNIGHEVISDPAGGGVQDSQYDGFCFFRDFGLDALTWKLGGHVDDHHTKSSDNRRRGFFEVALGNVSIQENLSKPITNDPWLLNQFIHAARAFYPIRPHSVHISLQLRTRGRVDRDRVVPLYAMKCLFALAGDVVTDGSGRPRILRLDTDEIINRDSTPSMLFSEVRRRYSHDHDEMYPGLRADPTEGREVQQFRFLRLSAETNYEPVVMALKGVQLSYRPGTFLRPRQYESIPRHRRLFERLLAWGQAPEPIEEEEIDRFCQHVQDGLMGERRGRPAHSEAYIMWSISQIREVLDRFNRCFNCFSPLAEARDGQ